MEQEIVSEAEVRERLAEKKRQSDALRRQHTKRHYEELSEARSKGIPVSWTPGGVVRELFDAMGIMGCSPENYSAMCAAKQLAGKFCEIGEAHGFSPDVCSYGRIIMGMMHANDGPMGPMPKPDIILIDDMCCDAHAKMWENPAKYFDVPLFRLDGAYYFEGKYPQRKLDYRVAQLKRLVAFCEEHLGVKFDYDRFKENMRVAAKVRELFTEIQNLRQTVPCPRTTRETSGDMFYLTTMPHSQEAVDYFTLVLEEVKERVKVKIGTVENERFRLFYDNISIWYWLQFFDYFHERGAAFAADSYTMFVANGYYADGGRFDPDQPFEALANRQIHTLLSTGLIPNLERYARAVEQWKIDGFVLFKNRGCKVFTAGSAEKASFLTRKYGIAVMTFEGEMADPRSINKAEVEDRASTFLEMLAERKRQVERVQ